jgi:hypothetical protein
LVDFLIEQMPETDPCIQDFHSSFWICFFFESAMQGLQRLFSFFSLDLAQPRSLNLPRKFSSDHVEVLFYALHKSWHSIWSQRRSFVA